MKYISFLLLSIALVCTFVYAQTQDSIPYKETWCPERYASQDSIDPGFDPGFDPGPYVPTPNRILPGSSDGRIRLEYRRGRCMVIVSDDSTGEIRGVYLSKIKYSHDSLKERKHGYYCQFDEQGHLVSIIEYRRGKKKHQRNLNWDAEAKRYY